MARKKSISEIEKSIEELKKQQDIEINDFFVFANRQFSKFEPSAKSFLYEKLKTFESNKTYFLMEEYSNTEQLKIYVVKKLVDADAVINTFPGKRVDHPMVNIFVDTMIFEVIYHQLLHKDDKLVVAEMIPQMLSQKKLLGGMILTEIKKVDVLKIEIKD